MDWKQGYVSTWRLYSVNQSTWGDGDELNGLVSASVTKDADSDLIEDASISYDGESINGYVRIVLEAENETSVARANVGTFLVTSPRRSINGESVTSELECYSVLKPAEDKILPPGWYFPEDGDPIAGVCNLLNTTLKCPVEQSESDIRTKEPKVAESGETVLSMSHYLLKDTGYFIDIDGYGRVSVKKKPDEVSVMFDLFENDTLLPELSDESDIFEIPNILRVTDNNGKYETIVNDDENSPTSVDNLGWEKWSSEQLTLEFGETLLSKGNERMKELSKTTRKISYSREYDPDVRVNDMALFLLPQQGIVGKFRIISQSISTGAGAKVNEIAIFEKENWRR